MGTPIDKDRTTFFLEYDVVNVLVDNTLAFIHFNPSMDK